MHFRIPNRHFRSFVRILFGTPTMNRTQHDIGCNFGDIIRNSEIVTHFSKQGAPAKMASDPLLSHLFDLIRSTSIAG